MNVNPAIFRAYDIRGKVGDSLTPQTSQLIGQAFGTYIKNLGGQEVSVSRDSRETSEALAKGFIDGVISTGLDVIDLGLTTTPMLYFSIIHKKLDGGAIITASHNTPDYNGVKLCQNNARHIFGEELQKIKKLAQTKEFLSGQGDLTDQDISLDYETQILKRIKLGREVRVAIDCSDGVSGLFTPQIFKKLGCQVITHACTPRGDFPHGGADPAEPQNLVDLSEVVLKNRADLGVGLDPDADRLGLINEKGLYVPIEAVAALLAKDILIKGSLRFFAVDIKALQGFAQLVTKYGGKVEVLATGRSYFRQKLYKSPEVALGVEASGHIHLNDNFYGFDDAVFAAARLIEILSQKEQTLSDLLSDFPKSFYTPSIKPYCPDDRKFLIVEEIKRKLSQKYDTMEIDGVKFFLDRNSWGLVRASNTGPHLSLRFEADTREKVSRIIEVVDNHLKSYSEVDQSWRGKADEEIR